MAVDITQYRKERETDNEDLKRLRIFRDKVRKVVNGTFPDASAIQAIQYHLDNLDRGQ